MTFFSHSQSSGFWICLIWGMVKERSKRKVRKGHVKISNIPSVEYQILSSVYITCRCENQIRSRKFLVTSSVSGKTSRERERVMPFGFDLDMKYMKDIYFPFVACNLVRLWLWIRPITFCIMT